MALEINDTQTDNTITGDDGSCITCEPLDLFSRCITCEPLDVFSRLSEDFLRDLGTALYDPILVLFTSLLALWAVVTGYKFLLAMISPIHVLRDLLGIIIAFALITTQGSTLITSIYSASLEIMTGAAVMAFQIGPGASYLETDSGIRGLMEATEGGVAEVFDAAGDILSDLGFMNPLKLVYAILLALPYFLVVVVFFSKVVVSMFRLMMIGVLAPFLIMFFAFGWGRGMAFSGAKTLLSSIFVLFAAAVSVGLLLYAVHTLGLSLKEDDIDGLSLLNSKYLTIMILGWLGVALMTEGIGIANSITGSLLSNTAASIITAGITGSAAAAAKVVHDQGGTAALKSAGLGILQTPVKETLSILGGNKPGVNTVNRLTETGKEVGKGIGKVLGFEIDKPGDKSGDKSGTES